MSDVSDMLPEQHERSLCHWQSCGSRAAAGAAEVSDGGAS